jgi:hypothetical protein
MPNPIKYSTGSESNALKKGNLYIGTGDVGKGPSDVTGFYQGVSPSAGGYVIYMNKSGAPGGLSYHNAPTDAELISFTNNLAGESYTTVNECLVYYAGQTDKVVLNRDYEGIVTDGLVLNLDAGFTPSYPKNGTTWYDVSGSNNGTLTNGPTFNSGNGGIITFDGTNDAVDIGSRNGASFTDTDNMTVSIFLKINNKNVAGVLGRFITTASADGWCVWVYNNKIIFFNSNAGGYDPPYNNTGYSFVNGEWFHFCVTRNSSTKELKWYVNGQLNQEYTTSSSTFKKTNNGISIASLGNSYYMNGDIGLTQIYNRALSASEVLQNYNAQKGRFGL